jgi:hypothetical protein
MAEKNSTTNGERGFGLDFVLNVWNKRHEQEGQEAGE